MLKNAFNGWFRRVERARQRRALARIPDFVLRDIGLTHDDLNRNADARSLGW